MQRACAPTVGPCRHSNDVTEATLANKTRRDSFYSQRADVNAASVWRHFLPATIWQQRGAVETVSNVDEVRRVFVHIAIRRSHDEVNVAVNIMHRYRLTRVWNDRDCSETKVGLNGPDRRRRLSFRTWMAAVQPACVAEEFRVALLESIR